MTICHMDSVYCRTNYRNIIIIKGCEKKNHPQREVENPGYATFIPLRQGLEQPSLGRSLSEKNQYPQHHIEYGIFNYLQCIYIWPNYGNIFVWVAHYDAYCALGILNLNFIVQGSNFSFLKDI